MSSHRITITNEREAGAGWSFDVAIAGLARRPDPAGAARHPAGTGPAADPAGAVGPGPAGPTEHEVRLSWADYEYWSHGSASPAAIVDLVLRFLLEQDDPWLELRPTLDLARVRRRWPAVDAYMATRV
jgi:hypothetical protein